MGSSEFITVNSFYFCLDHGDEFCEICKCDHRMRNNILIEKELGDMEEFLGFEVEERMPLNAYHLGAEPDLCTETSYRCGQHRIIDCKECFNWVEIIKRAAENTEERGRWLTSPAMEAVRLAICS